jgi:hypothetical protein
MSVDLVPSAAEIERLQGGGFESLSGWNTFPGGGSFNIDTSAQRSGASCLRADVGGAMAIERYDLNFAPGLWHRFDAYIKGSVQKRSGFGVRFVDLAGSQHELKTDGTWIIGNSGLYAGFWTVTTDWALARLYFFLDPSAAASDSFAISLQPYSGISPWNAGESLYVDDVSVKTLPWKPVSKIGIGALTRHQVLGP